MGEGKSARTIRVIHSVLRRALNQAIEWGQIGRNPIKGVKQPKQKKKEIKYYTEEQVKILLAEVDETRYHALYYLAVTTGMRQGELLGLKWTDIDWEHMTIQVRRQVIYHHGGGYSFTKPKSKSGIRTIILGKQAVDILQFYRESLWKIQTRKGADWD